MKHDIILITSELKDLKKRVENLTFSKENTQLCVIWIDGFYSQLGSGSDDFVIAFNQRFWNIDKKYFTIALEKDSEWHFDKGKEELLLEIKETLNKLTYFGNLL